MQRLTTAGLQPHERIIFAYDVSTFDKASVNRLESLLPYVGMTKFGLEFFAALLRAAIAGDLAQALMGLRMLQLVGSMGKLCMLDPKVKDIFNTVKAAAEVFASIPSAGIFTYHATMRPPNIEAILKPTVGTRVIAAGVSILTDHTENDAADIYGQSLKGAFLGCAERVAAAAHWTGARAGLVSSPKELRYLRENTAPVGSYHSLIRITPGIRSDEDPPDDQERTMTAQEAIATGADYLVIGRPIRNQPDWPEAAKRIAGRIEVGLAS